MVGRGELRSALERDFASSYGRSPQRKQLDWLERLTRQLAFAEDEGVTIDRTIRQIVKGLKLTEVGNLSNLVAEIAARGRKDDKN